MIKEKRDRKVNPYWMKDGAAPLEDDYSEESDPDSICKDIPVGIRLFCKGKWIRPES